VSFSPELIDDLLERAAREHPDRLAVVGTNTRLDYRAFFERTERLAHGLRALGVQPGERIAILSKNSPAYLEFILRCRASVRWPFRSTIASRRKSSASSWTTVRPLSLLFAAEYAGAGFTLKAELYDQALHRNRRRDGAPRAPRRASRAVARRSDDVFLQSYTSGTTGRPQGAMLTHANLIANTLTALAERDYAVETLPARGAAVSSGRSRALYGMTHACAGNGSCRSSVRKRCSTRSSASE
jgi:fatty-acyl-CoA synthase